MASCYINSHISNHKDKNDKAFMGRSHALSAVAVFAAVAAFSPSLTYFILGEANQWIFITALFVIAGASLLPDLDNSSSTARNSLGPLGVILSGGVRAISALIQTTIRTHKDDHDPDPHRGFAHTIPGNILFGLGVWSLSLFTGELELPIIGKISYGDLLVIVAVGILIHLTLEALFKEFMNQLGQSLIFGEIVEMIIAFALAFFLISNIPNDTSYVWLGASVAVGCFIHIFGDCFTTAGCPILFPIPRRGKMWWKIRFTSMKAGGATENYIFIPLFLIIIVISLFKIFNLF
jgi:membrane-bound metal-dependent hydrolase YbcI (DUF457 family)